MAHQNTAGRRADHAKQFQTQYDAATSFNLDKLTTAAQHYGNPDALTDVIQPSLDYLHRLHSAGVDRLPANTSLQVVSETKHWVKFLNAASQATSESDFTSALSQIEQRLTQLKGDSSVELLMLEVEGIIDRVRAEDLTTVRAEWTKELTTHTAALEATKDVWTKELGESRTQLETQLKRVQGVAEQAATALRVAQDAALQAGVAEYAKIYQAASEDYRREGHTWMVVLVCVVGVASLVITEVARHWHPNASDSAPAQFQAIAVKLLLVSLLIYGITFCVRGYRAARHNETIARSRYHALGTVEKFVAAAATVEARDVVVQQAAAAIFQNQPTGYGTPDPGPLNLMDIKNIVPKG